MINYLKVLDRLEWNRVDEILIDKFCWDYPFKPLSKAKLCLLKNQGICVKMWSYEDNPISICTQNNEYVNYDSCLEFFFNVFPEESNIYLNFEVNHLGTMLIQYGSGRGDRKFLSTLNVEYPTVTAFTDTDVLGEYWGIEYTIPLDLIEAIYGKSDIKTNHIIRAALYKCGDNTGRPHYGSWQPIGTERPDFHRPEFFGELVIKE